MRLDRRVPKRSGITIANSRLKLTENAAQWNESHATKRAWRMSPRNSSTGTQQRMRPRFTQSCS